jgi:hypothetical protein
MSALSIQPTYPIFTDIDGQPLEDGYIWIGTANLDPQVNPINVFWDAALTIPAGQPIRTLAGYPANSGTPARLYVNSDYSIRVMNKNGSAVYSAPSATERYNNVVLSSMNASEVIYDPAGTGAQETNAQQKMRQTISVFDFMTAAEITDVQSNAGLVDVSAKIRLALDYAFSLGKQCQLYFPPGTYYVPSTVFIPRSGGGRSGGLIMTGYGATIKGAGEGSGVIFETGAQTYSTGASTNWGFPESYLHYGQIIEGFYFQNCHTALKLYNFLEGCRVQNCSGYDLVTFINAERSFYGDFVNNRGGSALTYNNPGDYTDEDAVYRFAGFVNVQNIDGNSVVRGKTGFYFASGMSGLMSANNSAESCRKGLVITGAVYGALFYGWYLEGNDRDIEVSDGNGKDCLTIDGFWCTSADLLYAETWRSGEFGKNMFNYSGGSIDASEGLNQFHIWPPRASGEVNAPVEYASNTIPANWNLNASVVVHVQETRYVAASGPSNVRYGLAENYIGGNGLIVPRHFKGSSKLTYLLPYCTQDVLSVLGDATIDTKINYDQYEAGIRFDLTVLDNTTTRRLSGWILGTTVYRDDANAQTVVASNNAGFYRIVLSGFSVASPIQVLGGIRVL